LQSEANAADDFAALAARQARGAANSAGASITVARLYGFDVLDRPLLSGLTSRPGEVVTARSTIALRRDMLSAEVLVLFENGDATRPIITGVLQNLAPLPAPAPQGVTIHADETRHVVTAEREIVLRCGDASITLTRAGQVIIQGNYIVSRSSGHNKIKGAAIELN
jgi:hypothetical protein